MPLSAICAGWLADSLMRGRDTASVCSDPFLSEVGTRSSGGGHVASKLMPEEAVCVQAAELAEAGSEAEAEVFEPDALGLGDRRPAVDIAKSQRVA